MAELRKITKEELREVLRKHKLWLDKKEGGERADLSWSDLSWSDLSGANLSGANLRGADLSEANLGRADLRRADLSVSDLSWSNLSWSDLSGANLRGADLSGADLDFSCVPLWCGTLKAHFDDRQIVQILYHAIKSGVQSNNTSEELKNELYKLSDLANKFYKVEECGRVIYPPKETKEGEEE